jgi:hypothetical protein
MAPEQVLVDPFRDGGKRAVFVFAAAVIVIMIVRMAVVVIMVVCVLVHGGILGKDELA